DQANLDAFARRFADPRLQLVRADVTDRGAIVPLMEASDVAVSAVNYWFNADLAAMAVAGRCHFLDLGGNNAIVAQEFALDAEARRAGCAIVPDCGLAPGLAGILGYWLVDGLDRTASLQLRVGGLPAAPQPPMNYKVVFSVEGLINEYIEPAVVIRGGRLQTVPSLSELETITFPAPFGELEAFQTSGGTSTLPQTLLGRVPDLDYKTIRYKGHCAQVRLLHELGLTEARPVDIGGVTIAPRRVLAHALQKALDLPGEDVVLVQCTAEGWIGERAVRRRVRIIDRHDRATGLSAMMRMTGFPAAIIAHLLAAGAIAERGALRQEQVVPGRAMIDALVARGVAVEETESAPGEPA
ncbi:MAG TPA: saccharopine dehydrogenase C-terminal domain-containing protein, partial [Candidatus Krumholzibacteria bacterium]|nr:saccharopine dehydrogenase C-terminal domain-containing protein [Candidatus Krumholzibacteria bacterium]